MKKKYIEAGHLYKALLTSADTPEMLLPSSYTCQTKLMSCQVVVSHVKTLKIVVVKVQFCSNTEPVDIMNLIIFVYHSETKEDTLL